MKQHNLLLTFLGLIFLWSCDQVEPTISQSDPAISLPVTDTGEPDASHPGNYQQWLDARKNDAGVIPKGLRAEWRAHDASLNAYQKTTTTYPFENLNFLGPRGVGGRTRAIMMDMGDQEVMFAGGIQGGFWRSTNMGANWSRTDDNAENLAVTCITQSRFNNNVIYYGTGDAKNTGGVGSGEGIFKSTDGGLSFTQLGSTVTNTDFHTVSCLKHDIKTNNTIYAGTQYGGLYRSKNGGNTWTNVDATGHVRDLEIFPNGEVLFSISTDGMYRSSTGDPGTFTKIIDSSFPSTFNRIEICKAPSNPDVVYAMFGDPNDHAIGMFRSYDRGVSWLARALPEIGPTQGVHNLALGVHATDPNKIVAGATNIRISHDSGFSWDSVGNTHVDYHDFAVRSNDPDYFWIGNDGGVYKQAWDVTVDDRVDLNYQYGVTQFYGGGPHPINDAAIAGAQDNGTWKVKYGTEVKVGKNDGGFAYVHQQTPHIAYRSWQGSPNTDGPIHMITDFNVAEPDYGDRINNNSTMDAEGYDPINFFLMNSGDGEQIYCRTAAGVWRTTDASLSTRSWDKITGSISSITMLECSRSYDPMLYIGGKSGLLYYIPHASTSVAGDEVNLSASLPSSVQDDYLLALKVHPNNDNAAFLGFSNYEADPRIWKLTGASSGSPVFTDISGDLPSSLGVNTIDVDPWSPDDNIYIGTDFGMYYTENGGTNWHKISNVPNMAIQQVKIRPYDRKMFIITFGRGIWTMELQSCDPITQFPYADGFESGLFKGWYNDSNDDINWKLGSGPTPTLLTGPFSAVEGSNYRYIEASAPNNPNKVARLLSPCYDLSGLSNPRIKWNYNMNGSQIGELRLGISTNGGGTWTNLWTRSSSAGYAWQTAFFDLSAYSSEHEVTFRFSGKTGNGELGDIALDHIELVDAASKAESSELLSETDVVRAFPNPFMERLSVQVPEAAKVSLFSLNGTRVYESQVPAGTTEIPVQDLASGTYLLQVQRTNSRKLFTLIKQ